MKNPIDIIRTPFLPGYFHMDIFFLQIVRWPKKVLKDFFVSDQFKDDEFHFIGFGVGPRYFGFLYAGDDTSVSKTDKGG